MLRVAAVLVMFAATAIADEAVTTPPVPAVEPAQLAPAESQYSTEAGKADVIISKAQAEAAKIREAASEKRLKAYREHLVEVTKTGDFDKATAVKARITQLENDPWATGEKAAKRPRPKDLVKFGGHNYAVIKEPATWHVAKRRCEEMGGHLACIETASEEQFIKSLCGQANVWVGGSDEETEGLWKWCLGDSPVRLKINIDKASAEHHLSLFASEWHDGPAGDRHPYVCEWDR